MTDLSSLKSAVLKLWGAKFRDALEFTLPDTAKFVTGVPRTDACLHHLETECGAELKLSDNFKDIVDCNILDEKKYVMFLLKWS